MSYNVGNEDLKVSFTNTGGPPDLVYSGDQSLDAVKIVAQKSSSVTLNSKKLCYINIIMTFSGACPFTSALYNFVSGGGSISMSKLTKVKASSNTPDAKDDQGNCSGGWTLKAYPNTPVSCACIVKISDAGQIKVTAS